MAGRRKSEVHCDQTITKIEYAKIVINIQIKIGEIFVNLSEIFITIRIRKLALNSNWLSCSILFQKVESEPIDSVSRAGACPVESVAAQFVSRIVNINTCNTLRGVKKVTRSSFGFLFSLSCPPILSGPTTRYIR